MIPYNTPEFIYKYSYKFILFEVMPLLFDIINPDFKSLVTNFKVNCFCHIPGSSKGGRGGCITSSKSGDDFNSSNSVCNHTRDKQIGLLLRGRPILLHSYDNRPNWTPLSPVTITYTHDLKIRIYNINKIINA